MTIRIKDASGNTKTVKTRSRRDFINQTVGGIALLGAPGGGILTRIPNRIAPGKQK